MRQVRRLKEEHSERAASDALLARHRASAAEVAPQLAGAAAALQVPHSTESPSFQRSVYASSGLQLWWPSRRRDAMSRCLLCAAVPSQALRAARSQLEATLADEREAAAGVRERVEKLGCRRALPPCALSQLCALPRTARFRSITQSGGP